MKISQTMLHPQDGWGTVSGALLPEEAQLVLAFGFREIISAPEVCESLRTRFPAAQVVMASTSGNLMDQMIDDAAVVCTAVAMEKSTLRAVSGNVADFPNIQALGKDFVARLAGDGLRHVWVISDGGMVNGTELCQAFNANLSPGVALSGGLAGDGTAFSETVVGLNQTPRSGNIVAVGFYGDAVQVSWGSAGGWSSFGPERRVTRSDGNCLHELDGKPALLLYKNYLGEFASGLPASALRFPLSVVQPGQETPVVRTILSINEAANTMTFAGDIPEGATVRLMRASYEDLIDGAREAAQQASMEGAELVLCVSCVGRRILLGQRTEEEPECLRAMLGPVPVICGFYSYGELVPSGQSGNCQLQNQTMTLTCLRES